MSEPCPHSVGQQLRPFCVRVSPIVYLTFCLPFPPNRDLLWGEPCDRYLCFVSFVLRAVVFLLSAPGKRGSSFGGKIFQRVNFLSSRSRTRCSLFRARESACKQTTRSDFNAGCNARSLESGESSFAGIQVSCNKFYPLCCFLLPGDLAARLSVCSKVGSHQNV